MTILWFSECNNNNKKLVGGKNSSLGELKRLSTKIDFKIADGFAITTDFYCNFIENNGINDIINQKILNVDIDNFENLNNISNQISELFNSSKFTTQQIQDISKHYLELCQIYGIDNLSVAVRSSAVAEDMPNASFAGQQDTFLNVRGIDMLLEKVKECFSSLFTSRAISYRKTHNIGIDKLLMSVGVQKMVRSDLGSSGVGFSIDPETGYKKAIVINSVFGIGELLVSGKVKPDEFIVDKRVLSEPGKDPIVKKQIGDKTSKIIYDKLGIKEVATDNLERENMSLSNNYIKELGKIIKNLENEYKQIYETYLGIDVEWALDGVDKKLYIVQTRPETVHSNLKNNSFSTYSLQEKGPILLEGVPVGEKISVGKIVKMESLNEYKKFKPGNIILTEMTTPDWEPLMKKSGGIITNKGGRTCHAAIVARELGINAIVGTRNGYEAIDDEQMVTLSTLNGRGIVYKGCLKYEKKSFQIEDNIELPFKMMLNIGNPDSAFNASLLPSSGVGLARLEFIINNYIKIHPSALVNLKKLESNLQSKIKEIIGDKEPEQYFIEKLSMGIGQIASSFYPREVIIRLSDFKSNEYKNLLGGDMFEPDEENPMIGWRGASRYYDEDYEDSFRLECEALKYARENMGMSNIVIMVPFCRTPEEMEKVCNTMGKYGLTRGVNGLKLYLMCEIPSNVMEADNFSKYIDGISIGGNDLLQLTLGIDRDSEKITHVGSDKNMSYRRLISKAIKDYKKYGIKVGFCGQQPSDSTEFFQFLVNEGIDTISITPDSILKTMNVISQSYK